MKKNFTLLCFVMLMPFLVFSQSNFFDIHYLDPYNPEYVKGEVLVKFKDEVHLHLTTKSSVAKTGISSVDKILAPYQTMEVSKVFKETREQRQKKSIKTIRDFKGNEIEVPALYNIYKLKFDTVWDAKQIIEDLKQDENIEFAEPNYLVYTTEVMESGIVPSNPPIQTPLPSVYSGDRNTYPNDPLYQDGSQWYLDSISAPAAWDTVTGDSTQIIAIIDTGVDWDHPDLDDNIWTNWDEIPDNGIDDDNNGYIDDTRGWDYINNDNDPNDDNSHGTHVAGIAAAEGNNGIGICGVAWNARIMPVKVLQSSGVGNSSDFAAGINYASDNGATVINMSMGSYGESLTVKTALENAYAGTGSGSGSILVAAAGNNHLKVTTTDPCGTYGVEPMPMYPACYSWVIGVMANDAGPCSGFSNWDFDGLVNDLNYEIQAKGVGIMSCKPNGAYWTKSGTSMASPEVAGAVALMQEYDTTQSGEQIFAKLIQGANAGLLDIYSSLNITLLPDLYYIDNTILDTCQLCDGDGSVDAGDTISMYLSIKNGGGFADSVWSIIRFAPFEDTTVATIIDSTSYIGNISAYATLTGELNPFIISIDPNTVNDRDIVLEYEVGCKNSANTISGQIILKVQNGEELSGIMDSTLTLTADKLWIINESFKVSSTGKLILEHGTELVINKKFAVDGIINAIGTKEDRISIIFNVNNERDGIISYTYPWGPDTVSVFKYVDLFYSGTTNNSNMFNRSKCIFYYCTFSGNPLHSWFYAGNVNIFHNCIFHDLVIYEIQQGGTKKFYNCNFTNLKTTRICDGNDSLKNSNFSNITNYYSYSIYSKLLGVTSLLTNNLLTKTDGLYIYSTTTFADFDEKPNVYWGTVDLAKIKAKTWDFFDSPSYAELRVNPILTQPSDSAHGCVWKVEIDSIDPQDETLDPLGAGTYQFDVYFNKCMDTLYTPRLSFGVREPHVQHIVSDSAHWSADSTVWTAYKTIGVETGDGINYIRVDNARDTAGFVIPSEDNKRFQFVIRAASAASIDFLATAGIGKVALEWPPTPSADALGYNLYRYNNLTDSTFSDTVRINTNLVLDTVYTDYNVIPDTTYHYLYKTLGTDMVETDYSKSIAATPFNAANGDANGDLAVNVLDITNIVSYLLNQNPTPFLFDAADVNYDGEINVLDIIGLVQLINSKKSVSTQPLPNISNEIAYYSFNDNRLSFESKGNVAALQFKLKINGEKANVQKMLNDLRILSLAKGFEFSYGVVDDEIIGLLYSLTGIEIPEGISELFRFEKVDINTLQITEIFGGDLNGDYVPVYKKGEHSEAIGSELTLRANPNPFSYSTVFNYTLPEEGIVQIKVYEMNGSNVAMLLNGFQPAGSHTLTWKGINSEGQQLKSGIYLVQSTLKTVSGKKYSKEIKIVLVK